MLTEETLRILGIVIGSFIGGAIGGFIGMHIVRKQLMKSVGGKK